MRHLVFVVVVVGFGFGVPSVAQQARWDAGAFAELGGLERSTSLDAESPVAGAAGLYAEWLRPRYLSAVNVGLELRADAGPLVGPHVSTGARGPAHAYAGALFGPTHAMLNPGTVIYPPGATAPTNIRYGVTSEAVLGVEVDLSKHVRWRAIELTQAWFSGIAGSHPFSVQTGIVWHVR